MMKVVITYAVKEELEHIDLKGIEIKYIQTGIGKARSAMLLTKAICDERPDVVLNIGTAGTLKHQIGDILLCRQFVDRDFEALKLPGVIYELSFTDVESLPNAIVDRLCSSDTITGVCNTGDQFVTDLNHLTGDVVEMEAFAQAVVCKEFNIPFIAIKYVTDIIGKNSVKHWEEKLTDARLNLTNYLIDTFQQVST